MDINVPYLPAIKNLPLFLTKIQQAAVPDAFGVDFLRDLGFRKLQRQRHYKSIQISWIS